MHSFYDKLSPYEVIIPEMNNFLVGGYFKKELFESEIYNKYYCIAVFDDRQKVIDMERLEGLLACQVYYGDF